MPILLPNLLFLCLMVPPAAMLAHAFLRTGAAGHARLAIFIQSAYGVLLAVVGVTGLASGLFLRIGGPSIPLGAPGFSFQPSFYLNAGNASLLLMTGISLPLTFIWLRDRAGRYGASYYVSANLLVFSLVGVFTAHSLVLFYLFWELALLGAYFWIGMHGKSHAHTPALYTVLIRFVLMTLLGSLPMLLSIALICAEAGGDPGLFGIEPVVAGMDSWARWIAFAGFGLAFAVKTPLLGLHGWLRDTYNVAPAACRTVLSALMSKMGAYGLVFVLAVGFREQCRELAPFLLFLSVTGAVYGGLLCLASERFLDILVYSSLAHLSLIALGVFAGLGAQEAYATGVTGALLLLFSHGLIMTALFSLDARVTVTGESVSMYSVAGLRSGQRRLSGLLLLAIFASAGLPGLSNFAGELLVLFAAFRSSPWLAFFGAAGALVVAAALVRAYHALFLGEPDLQAPVQQASDLSVTETALALGLAVVWLVLGLYPMLLVGPVEKVFLVAGMGAL